MKQFIMTAVLVIASALPSLAHSETKKFIQLSDGVERYVEYTKPKAGKPWIVFTNGLVYDIKRWGAMDSVLEKQGFGILHYYYRGQDLTLQREVQTYKKPAFFATGLTPNDFTQELKEIIETLDIQEKIVLVGLSYGSHVAANFAQKYPRKVEQLVFLAPLVVPLERYQPQGVWLDWNLSWVKALWGDRYYEQAYRQIFATYLNRLVTEDRVPASLAKMPNEYRESLFHLVRVTRDFDLKKYDFGALTKKSVYYVLAQEETPLAFTDQIYSFELLDKKAQGSLIWLPDAQHAIPDAAPAIAAKIIQAVIQEDPRFQQGQKYKHTSKGLQPL